MKTKRTKSSTKIDNMNLIGTSITACSDATSFERNKAVEEEALLKINDMLRRRRISITDTCAANTTTTNEDKVSLMTEANDILQLMIRLYKTNDKNEDTMQKLQQQLVSMSTVISNQDDQLANERKGFATVVSKLNKQYKRLEQELKKKESQLQTYAVSKSNSWEGSPRSTCCSASTNSTADMTHTSSLYGDDSTLDGDGSTKASAEESVEVWQERYDELVEKITHLADENGDLLHQCNVLEEQLVLSRASHHMSIPKSSSLGLERKYKEALSRIDSLQSENDELQIASIGMHNMMTTYENEIANLNKQLEEFAISKMEMERRVRVVEEQNVVLRRKASYAAKRSRSLRSSIENLDDIDEEEMCDNDGGSTCHVDFLLRQGSIASRRRSIM